jgi:hypothetical protein
MRALRVTTNTISVIFIAVTMFYWLGSTFQGWLFTLMLAAVDVYYVGLIWAQDRFKTSKYANLSVSIAFALSLVPVAAFVYFVYLFLNAGVC